MLFNSVIPYSSGYSMQLMNDSESEIENKGIDFSTVIIPIERENFSWALNFHFSKNNNLVIKLPDAYTDSETGISKLTINAYGTPSSGYLSLIAAEGYPLGIFEMNQALTVTDVNSSYFGSFIVDRNNGLPITSTEKTLAGNSNFDYTMGFGSTIQFYGLSFYVLFDYRKGGMLYSRTADMTYYTGNTPYTTYNDRQPFIIPNSVVEIISNGEVQGYEENTIPVSNNIPNGGYGSNMINYWQNGGTELWGAFLIPRTYLKLRDVSLSYNLPEKWVHKVYNGSLNLSLYGQNLFIWTAEENRFIDPETTSFGSGIASDYGEFGSTPSARNYGFRINISF